MGKKARIKQKKAEEKRIKWEDELKRRGTIFRGGVIANVVNLKEEFVKLHNEDPTILKVPMGMKHMFNKTISGMEVIEWDELEDKDYIDKEGLDVTKDVALL